MKHLTNARFTAILIAVFAILSLGATQASALETCLSVCTATCPCDTPCLFAGNVFTCASFNCAQGFAAATNDIDLYDNELTHSLVAEMDAAPEASEAETPEVEQTTSK